MTLLDKLETIGRAKPGTRMLVCEPLLAVRNQEGGEIKLPIGTKLEVTFAIGSCVSAVADLNERLVPVTLFVDHYHMVEIEL